VQVIYLIHAWQKLLLWFVSTIVARPHIKMAEKYCSMHYGGTDSVLVANLLSKLLLFIDRGIIVYLYDFTTSNQPKTTFERLPIPVTILLVQNLF